MVSSFHDFLIPEKLKTRPKIFEGQNKSQADFSLDFWNFFYGSLDKESTTLQIFTTKV